MTHFIGIYRYKVDIKNRLFIPAKMRKGVMDFILTNGLDGCLFIYPKNNWKVLVDKFENMPLDDKYQERAFKRAFLSNAIETKVDGQGRIIIPQGLYIQAKIDKEIVILGVGNRLEIWAKERWSKYYPYAKTIFDRLKSKLEL